MQINTSLKNYPYYIICQYNKKGCFFITSTNDSSLTVNHLELKNIFSDDLQIEKELHKTLQTKKTIQLQNTLSSKEVSLQIEYIAPLTVAIFYNYLYEDFTLDTLKQFQHLLFEYAHQNNQNFFDILKKFNTLASEILKVDSTSIWMVYHPLARLECKHINSNNPLRFSSSHNESFILQNNSYIQTLIKEKQYLYQGKNSFIPHELQYYIKKFQINFKYDIPIFYHDELFAVFMIEHTKVIQSKHFFTLAKQIVEFIEILLLLKTQKENDEKLNAIIKNENTGIIIYRDSVLYANDAISKINGFSFKEMQQIKTWDLFAPEIRPFFQKIITQRMQGEQLPKNYNDAKIITKDKKIKTVRISAETIKYEGKYAGISTIVDITDLIEAQEQLNIFAQAIEQADEMIKITDVNGKIIYANKAISTLTQYSNEELIGTKTNIFKSGEHPRKFYKKLWDTILKKKTYRDIIINKKKNGEIYYEDLTITPMLDKNNQIKYFIATSKDVTEHILIRSKLQKLATTDTLTQIHNRYKMDEEIDLEIKKAKRYTRSFALLMIDIDFFKLINDSYGHDIGDEILQELTTLIQKNIRQSDSFARWGGEEFIILARNVSKEEAIILAKNILHIIRRHIFSHNIQLTISIGIALYHSKKSLTKSALLKQADEALYHAKNNGRDQLFLWDF